MAENLRSIVRTYTGRFDVNHAYFDEPPAEDLCLVICIPAFKEENILGTLESLAACAAPGGTVEVIITVNAPEQADTVSLQANEKTLHDIDAFEKTSRPDYLRVFVIRKENIPKKLAGAGYARKLGMDEAVQRWALANHDGPIICLDADCTVSTNYMLQAVQTFHDPSVRVAHFHFEHEYEKEKDVTLREGIVCYELHLRCYVHGLKTAGYPFAVHTVGSSMGVRASAYARAGGMNKRKAGEDFYFLHKLAPLGGWRNIVTATVFPSCRASDRVPFGTGRSQLEWKEKKWVGLTYNPEIYRAIQPVFGRLTSAYEKGLSADGLLPEIRFFLEQQRFTDAIASMKKQANSKAAFAGRVWQWMDGFRVLKLTHYLRDQGFPDRPVFDVAQSLLLQQHIEPAHTLPGLLQQFRMLDKGGEVSG